MTEDCKENRETSPTIEHSFILSGIASGEDCENTSGELIFYGAASQQELREMRYNGKISESAS